MDASQEKRIKHNPQIVLCLIDLLLTKSENIKIQKTKAPNNPKITKVLSNILISKKLNDE